MISSFYVSSSPFLNHQMAPESCNLGKDEAEILNPSSPKPSNTSLSSASSQPIPQQSSSCLLLEPLELVQAQRSERPETSAATAIKLASLLKPEEESQSTAQFGNRCSTCRKRIALSGFRCRCGDLFCSRHRYSDTHDCSFDYKAAGREEISKANPLIRAAKIIKI